MLRTDYGLQATHLCPLLQVIALRDASFQIPMRVQEFSTLPMTHRIGDIPKWPQRTFEAGIVLCLQERPCEA